jgi:hypothetical protein
VERYNRPVVDRTPFLGFTERMAVRVEIPTILMITGTGVAVALAIDSLARLIRKTSAMRRLRQLFLAEANDSWAKSLRSLGARLTEDPYNPERMGEAEKAILQIFERLSDGDRRILLEGLYQPSFKGRSKYMLKILDVCLAKKIPPQPSNRAENEALHRNDRVAPSHAR